MTLGLCSQIELDAAVLKAALRLEREAKKLGGPKLKSTEESLAESAPARLETPSDKTPVEEAPLSNFLTKPVEKAPVEKAPDADAVFASLKDNGDDAAKE